MAQADRGLAYRVAVQRLAEARIRYSIAFLRFKIGGVTDGQAHQQAILETEDELTRLDAEVSLAAVDAGVRRCP